MPSLRELLVQSTKLQNLQSHHSSNICTTSTALIYCTHVLLHIASVSHTGLLHVQSQSSAGSHPSDGSEPTIGSISQVCSHAKLLLSSAKKKAGFPGAHLIRNWWGRWENWTGFMDDTTSLCVQPCSLNSYQQLPKPKAAWKHSAAPKCCYHSFP